MIVRVFVFKACSDVIIYVLVDLYISFEVRLDVDFGFVRYRLTLDFVTLVV